MKSNLAIKSLLLFGLSILLLILLTLFESALLGLSSGMERVVAFLLLVVPAAVGCVLGVMSLVRKEGHPWLAVIGIVLNALFAVFHIAVLSFAG
jgi:hypothetical protein